MGRLKDWLLVVVFLTGVAVGLFPGEVFAGQKKIGILLWSDEVRYRESTQAMLEQLRADGFDLEIRQESSGADKVTAMRLAQSLAMERMDVYVGVGTNALAALQKEITDIPIVFNYVYDPVGSGFVATWQHSKNNITGVSNFLPMEAVLRHVKSMIPLKNLAVLYTPGQRNSEAQLKDLQNVEKECSVNIVPVPLSNEEDVLSAIPLLKGKVEAVFLTGSGIVGTFIGVILDAVIKVKIAPVSHLPDYVDQGVLLGAGADVAELGRMAAGKVEEVLKGAAPTDIPVEGPKKMQFYLNLKTARAIGVTVPDDFRKEAVKIIE